MVVWLAYVRVGHRQISILSKAFFALLSEGVFFVH